MQIAIADTTGKVILWCAHEGFTDDGAIKFYVINGAWHGSIQGEVVCIDATKKSFNGNHIVWQGKAPYSDRQYNEAMEWIQRQVPKGIPRDYIWVNSIVFTEEKQQKPRRYDDDIPF